MLCKCIAVLTITNVFIEYNFINYIYFTNFEFFLLIWIYIFDLF